MSHKLRLFKSLAAPGAIVAALFSSGVTAGAFATPLNIGASVSINSDIGLEQFFQDITTNQAAALTVTGVTDSAVNDPSATNDSDQFVQIGNVTTEPPTPYIATAFNQTAQPDGDSARGFYYVDTSLRTTQDTYELYGLERNLIGSADLVFSDLETDASASSDFVFSRDIILTNTSATKSYGFGIGTGFEMGLAASADAIGSQSAADAVFSLSFITSGTVFLDYEGQHVESTSISDSDPGVAVDESLVTSNALFDGVHYEASVSAMGVGAPTEATLDVIKRFYFWVLMGPNSSLRLTFYQSQSTATSYIDPSVSEVPIPASALLFLGGLGFFVRIGRKAKETTQRAISGA